MKRIVMTNKVTSMEYYEYLQMLKKYSVIENYLHVDEDINTTEAFFLKTSFLLGMRDWLLMSPHGMNNIYKCGIYTCILPLQTASMVLGTHSPTEFWIFSNHPLVIFVKYKLINAFQNCYGEEVSQYLQVTTLGQPHKGTSYENVSESILICFYMLHHLHFCEIISFGL